MPRSACTRDVTCELYCIQTFTISIWSAKRNTGNLQLPVHCLKRDKPTRWNILSACCKFFLGKRWHWLPVLVNIVPLTSVQLDVAIKVIKVLLVKEMTGSICTGAAYVSLIIEVLQFSLEQADGDDDRGVKTLKKNYLPC